MPRKYAVAISYPGAHRALVHSVANHLNNALVHLDGTVFLDLYNQIDFIGKVDTKLKAVYRDKCDIAVVFQSREYFESKWCKLEWDVLRKIMRRRRKGAPRVLSFRLDGFVGEHVPNYVERDVQKEKMTAEQIAHDILEWMNVTPWIANARFARKVLTDMKGDWVDWKFEHTIRDAASGTVYSGLSEDDWLPAAFAELCRNRKLSWSDKTKLPRNIVCCRGPHGVGKSVLLLRAVASAGKHESFPEHSWIVDFSNNKEVCKDDTEFEIVPAKALRKFLENQIRRYGRLRHIFLAIDGIDSAARHLSVRTDGMPAPRTTLAALRSLTGTLAELSRDKAAPFTVTLVLTLNAPKEGPWISMYEQLEHAGAVIAELDEQPPLNEETFERIYSKLRLPRGDAAEAARYLADRRFLRLPLFLDAASRLGKRELKGCVTRTDFLLAARKKGRISSWPNEIDELVTDLDQFIGAISRGLNGDAWLHEMLRLEWTGAWFELLKEAMRGQGVSGGMVQLMQSLLAEECRWDLSASYALSNVMTALCEAGKAPRLIADLRYYNLRRATLDNTVFGPQSTFFAVDCTGSSLNQVTLEEGCKFIATDFGLCSWDSAPNRSHPAFIECVWEKKDDSQ